jgi:hypothetical protein
VLVVLAVCVALKTLLVVVVHWNLKSFWQEALPTQLLSALVAQMVQMFQVRIKAIMVAHHRLLVQVFRYQLLVVVVVGDKIKLLLQVVVVAVLKDLVHHLLVVLAQQMKVSLVA